MGYGLFLTLRGVQGKVRLRLEQGWAFDPATHLAMMGKPDDGQTRIIDKWVALVSARANALAS